MKEKRDSEGVTSCETCAVNPCENNGVCQEAPTRLGYTCLCPRGYTGTNCSRNGEPCYQGTILLLVFVIQGERATCTEQQTGAE